MLTDCVSPTIPVRPTTPVRCVRRVISHYFQEIFISEDTGFHKPEKGYFDYCFARIPDFDPAMAMIVGDSLTSDILGGKNAGLRTCWFNRAGRPPRPDIVPDFEIHRLEELPGILEQC